MYGYITQREHSGTILSLQQGMCVYESMAMKKLQLIQDADYLKNWFVSPLNKEKNCQMVCKDKETGMLNKVVLGIQGFLMRKDLPPILNMPQWVWQEVVVSSDHTDVPYLSNPNVARYLKQSMTLAGLGCTEFDEAIATIRGAYMRLTHNYAPGSMQPWQPENFHGQCMLDLSNRYLMSQHWLYPSPMVPFQPGVNPNNVIAWLAAYKFSHLEENWVGYYKPDMEYTK